MHRIKFKKDKCLLNLNIHPKIQKIIERSLLKPLA